MIISDVKIGDYIKTKNGITDPDFDYQLIDNWHGKVVGVDVKKMLIEIKWDTKTLLEMPYQYLHDIISNGYDHEVMNLLISDIESAGKRDTSSDKILKLRSKLYWINFYETQEKNEMYSQIFKGIDTSDIDGLFQKWLDRLNTKMKFPFEVEVVESDRGGLEFGTRIKLLGLDDYYDEKYGVLGVGKDKREGVTIPVCNLEAVDKRTSNYDVLRDYVIWFANM